MLEIKQEVDEEPRSTAPDPLEIDFQTGDVNEQKHMQYLEVKEELIDQLQLQGPTGPERQNDPQILGMNFHKILPRKCNQMFGCDLKQCSQRP